jgi:hypothetical protein
MAIALLAFATPRGRWGPCRLRHEIEPDGLIAFNVGLVPGFVE